MKLYYKIYLLLLVVALSAACEDTDRIDPYVGWENPADMYLGVTNTLSEVQLNAIASTEGTYTYDPPIGTVLELGDDQELKLTFTPDDGSNYNTVEDVVFANVKNKPIEDADGNLYTEIEIGNQIWLSEPLITTHFNNFETIPYVADDTQWGSQSGPAFGWYQSNEAFATPWGGFYNQAVVNDPRGICPEGYHIPTQAEYQTLLDYVGGASGGSLLKSTLNWGIPGNNDSGFNAPGSSLRLPSGAYAYQTLVAFLWTTTASPDSAENKMIFVLHNAGTAGFQADGLPLYGLPIRCIKDSE
jgi:uncharacterized protein (TIGR02145 family)